MSLFFRQLLLKWKTKQKKNFKKGSSAWSTHHETQVSSRFPIISKLITRLVSSPAVSSPSERSFSTTRRIEKGDRNRLSEKMTEMLSFINVNMRARIPKVPISWADLEKALYSNQIQLPDLDEPSILELSNGDIDDDSDIFDPPIAAIIIKTTSQGWCRFRDLLNLFK